MKSWLAPAAVVLAFSLASLPAIAGGDGKKKKADSEKKPATVTVEKKPFQVEVSLKGVLEPEEAVPIAHRPLPTAPGLPYNPGPLNILKVVEHGVQVKAGDTLLEFDTRRIDLAITQVEADLRVLDASIKLAEEEQPQLEKSVPIELELAERGTREAEEDLAYFAKTGKAEATRRAEQSVKFAAFYLEFAQEQLRQLEKMYKNRDLTEDTEEIILKRQRFWVEEAKAELKAAEIERDHILKTVLPRREKALKEGAARTALALAKARATLSPMIAQKQQSLLKMHADRDRLVKGLEALRADRGGMTLKAPCAGTVYYGKLSRGKWEAAEALTAKLVPEGTVAPDEIVMTIIKPGPLRARMQVEEKDVSFLKPGLKGKSRVAAFPDVKVLPSVTSVSLVPTAPGKFEALIRLDYPADAGLAPGLACSVKFVPYVKEEVIVVPASAVFEKGDKHFVSVFRDGKVTPQPVTPGHTVGDRIEILEGLTPGQEILEQPEGGPAGKSAGGKDKS